MSGEIKKAIQKLANQPGEMYAKPCKVIAVDAQARTCDVEPLDGSAAIFSVRLQANISGTDGLCFIPKIESHVLVSWLSKEFAFVNSFTQVDSLLLKIDESEMIYTGVGLSLKSSMTTMRGQMDALVALIDGLITTLQGFQLNTTGAPGPTTGVMPQVLTELAQHRADLMTFQTNLNTLIAE